MRGVRISRQLESANFFDEAIENIVLALIMVSLLALLGCFAVFLLIIQEVLGAYRRCCNNEKLRLILWTAYTIPPSLIFCAYGLAKWLPKGFLAVGILYVVFLLIFSVGTSSFSAVRREDNEQWKRHNWQLLQMVAIGLALSVFSYADKDAAAFAIAVPILCLAALVKAFERAQASMLASKAVIQKNAKLIADYMMTEHLKSNHDEVDLTSMRGYTYLVRGEEEVWEHSTLDKRLIINPCFGRKKVVKAKPPKYHVPFKFEPHVITIEKIWQCHGNLLGAGDSDHRKKDLCLSFALFKILSLRFAGYSMPQEVYQKSWVLLQKIVLSKEDGYERAIRIIEVELAFVFCQFYTKYQFIFQSGQWMLKLREIVLVSIGCCVVAVLAFPFIDSPVESIALVTITMMIAFLISEILQLLFILFSEWGKVVLICNYVKRESWQKNKCIEKLINFVCDIEFVKPWERKLRQYSLLKSYKYNPSLLLYNHLTVVLIDQKKKGQEQITPVKLSKEVKSAIISPLLIEGTKLENGKISLIRNNLRKCLWACNLETQAQVILVWHIATSICEHEIPTNRQSQLDTLKHFKIATSLSKYLAYLVAFAPRLLPDHPYVTEYVFDQVIIEARDTFKKCNSLEKRIKELKDKRSKEGSETVIDRGARLGMQLLDVREPELVWKILADFWAELMLYVAPSDDMDAHVKHLSMGGEFVTQIWALLSHSGIGRDPPSKSSNLERSRSWSKA